MGDTGEQRRLAATDLPGEGLWQLPEVPSKADCCEVSLVACAVVRRPVRVETVAIPTLSEPPQLRHRKDRTRYVIATASVLFIPEEPHVSSGVAQILIPVGRGNEKMNYRFGGIERTFADPNRDWLTAVGTAALHDTVA